MEKAQLYFLSDRYYMDFPDDKLMKNKETTGGVPHNHPCFFALSDSKHPEIYWIIPISSKYEKFKKIAEKKAKKYGRCNTIRFGTVLERNTAFLIQNRIASDVIRNAKEVLGGATIFIWYLVLYIFILCIVINQNQIIFYTDGIYYHFLAILGSVPYL